MEIDRLYDLAREAANASYSPYSHFRVGAALECSDGSVFTGANIENRSFGLTVCAERSAVSAAASAGKREFVRIAVATPDAGYPVSPCGACRQVLSEFMRSEAIVAFGPAEESLVVTTMGELLPNDALHDLKDRA